MITKKVIIKTIKLIYKQNNFININFCNKKSLYQFFIIYTFLQYDDNI